MIYRRVSLLLPVRFIIKPAFDELLWIWQKSLTRVSDLGSHIWD